MRLILGVGLVLTFTCGAVADEKKDEKIDGKLLIGKWEPADGKLPKVVFEFLAAGKLKGMFELEDNTQIPFTGTYKLEGNKLVTEYMTTDSPKTEGGGKITNLTKETFELTSEFGSTVKFKLSCRLPAP